MGQENSIHTMNTGITAISEAVMVALIRACTASIAALQLCYTRLPYMIGEFTSNALQAGSGTPTGCMEKEKSV